MISLFLSVEVYVIPVNWPSVAPSALTTINNDIRTSCFWLFHICFYRMKSVRLTFDLCFWKKILLTRNGSEKSRFFIALWPSRFERSSMSLEDKLNKRKWLNPIWSGIFKADNYVIQLAHQDSHFLDQYRSKGLQKNKGLSAGKEPLNHSSQGKAEAESRHWATQTLDLSTRAGQYRAVQFT